MHSDQYGFLTTCPSNWGTALEVSVLCYLPRLVESGTLVDECKAANLQFQNHPDAEEDNTLQDAVLLKSITTFGITEVALVDSVLAAVIAITNKEIKLQQ